MNKYLIIAVVLLFTIAGTAIRNNRKLRDENNRQSSNLEQITAETQRKLVLSRGEYEKINAHWKNTLDSTIMANNIKLRQVKQATVVKVVYRDTVSVPSIESVPVLTVTGTDSLYTKTISYQDACWGMKGRLISRDPASRLIIDERSSLASIQLLVTEKRRWLFWKKRNFQAFSNCGELDVTQIDFAKN